MEQNNSSLAIVGNQAAIEQVVPPDYSGIATLKLSPEEYAILTAPTDPSMVKTRADGFSYVDQIHYRDRLSKALMGSWSLRCLDCRTEDAGKTNKGDPQVIMYYRGQLWVRGVFVSEAIGEQLYVLTNGSMTYATAYEAAKSNCLVRCCKDLSMFSELWDKTWLDQNKGGIAKAEIVDQSTGQILTAPTKDETTALLGEFGLTITPEYSEYNGKKYLNHMLACEGDPLGSVFPKVWLSKFTRGRDDAKDPLKGNWIAGGRISFSDKSLPVFLAGLKEYAKHDTGDEAKENNPVENAPIERDAPVQTAQVIDEEVFILIVMTVTEKHDRSKPYWDVMSRGGKVLVVTDADIAEELKKFAGTNKTLSVRILKYSKAWMIKGFQLPEDDTELPF